MIRDKRHEKTIKLSKRFDILYIPTFLLDVDPEEAEDLKGIGFVSKGLEREFLHYFVQKSGQLTYVDYIYSLVDNEEEGALFTKQLRRVDLGLEESYFTGTITIACKPYQEIKIFDLVFKNGMLKKCYRMY